MAEIQRDGAGIVETRYHWDEHTGELHVERVQDVEPLIDGIKRAKAHGYDGFGHGREGQVIAEIPIAIVEQWAKEGVQWWNKDHDAEIRKRINDPALSAFRYDATHSGNTANIIVKGKR
jgi:hypothetical protein